MDKQTTQVVPNESTTLPDMTPRREGGDDSLAESSPYDPRSDEKVLANEEKKIQGNTGKDAH